MNLKKFEKGVGELNCIYIESGTLTTVGVGRSDVNIGSNIVGPHRSSFCNHEGTEVASQALAITNTTNGHAKHLSVREAEFHSRPDSTGLLTATKELKKRMLD